MGLNANNEPSRISFGLTTIETMVTMGAIKKTFRKPDGLAERFMRGGGYLTTIFLVEVFLPLALLR